MNSFRSMSLPLFALIAALAGCSGEVGSATSADALGDISQTVTTQANVASQVASQNVAKKPGHRVHARRGDASLIRAALHSKSLNLTADQRTAIQALVTKPVKSANESGSTNAKRFDAARTQRTALLATAIRSGSFDAIPAAPAKQVDVSKLEARIAAKAEKLAKLHDILTPEQRTALVDSIQARHAARAQKRAAHVAKDDGTNAKQARKAHFGERGMFASLDMTQAQKDAFKAKLASMRPAKPSAAQREAMKARFAAIRAERTAKLESFKGSNFDAKSFVTPSKDVAQNGGRINRGQMGDRRLKMLEALTSVLDQGQREKLAQRIEAGPSRTVKPVAN